MRNSDGVPGGAPCRALRELVVLERISRFPLANSEHQSCSANAFGLISRYLQIAAASKNDKNMSKRGGESEKFILLDKNSVDPLAIQSVLDGQVVACIFRKAISLFTCESICREFLQHPLTARRSDAEAFYLGAYHFDKTSATYAQQSRATRDAISHFSDLFPELNASAGDAFRATLRENGVNARLATCDGEAVNPFILRRWAYEGSYTLDPHEDEAQCSDPRQLGFEAQAAVGRPIVAANACLCNGSGGELVIWNYRPAAEDRKRLGTENSGYPYPSELLQEKERLVVRVQAGDLYFFDGRYVHAVGAISAPRTTAAFFLGTLPDGTVLQWT